MPGYHVHAACGPGVLANGGLYGGMGVQQGRRIQVAVLLVSTPAHDLNRYQVYTSDGLWTMSPQFHDWTYQGTVRECFGNVNWMPRRSCLQRLLGPCSEFFCFANFDGCVTMYTRYTNQRPLDNYAVYDLLDVVDPNDFYRAFRMDFRGRWTMPGWA